MEKVTFRQNWYHLAFLAIAILGFYLPTKPVYGAEKIYFKYGIAGQSVSLEELEAFAQNAEMSPSIEFLLEFTNHNPELIRLLLVQEIPLDGVTASSLLNSPVGGYLLDRVSNIVNSGASKSNREALKGALIESAEQDGTISLLEVWRNYPTRKVVVDGKSWLKMTQGFSNTFEQVGKTAELSLALLQSFLHGEK